jgi:hypothetical protein
MESFVKVEKLSRQLSHLALTRFFIFFFVVAFTLGRSTPVLAEINPRVKALGTMAAYGTIGGALLGVASLAFGTGGRSIAKGASLGLYTGLIFGSYVVVAHAMKEYEANKPVQKDYEDTEGPYDSSEGEVEDDGGAGYPGGQGSTINLEVPQYASNFKASEKVFYMNIIDIRF